MRYPVWMVLPALALGSCALMGEKPADVEAPATVEEAREFLAAYDKAVRPISSEYAKAAWVQATYITEDTQLLAAKAYERFLAWNSEQAIAARRFDGLELDADSQRQLDLLRLSNGVPTDPDQLAELTTLGSRLEALYGSGRYCPDGEDSCRDLGDLEDELAKSRKPDELLDAWRGWRTVSPPMREDYSRFVALQNIGAQELGFADAGQYWRAGYDMDPLALEAEVERRR